MCGIAGFSEKNEEKMKKMLFALRHRGPDGQGIACLDNATLGHARLAILDPRTEGNQPMWNDDKSLCIIFNGEIFNFKEIQKKEQFICKTNTDTEVLLRYFERYGIDCFSRIRGMFACAIYNAQEDKWFLTRDTSGIKPLFITYEKGILYFASEIRALLQILSEKPKMNTASLSNFLRLQYVPGPETLCEEIENLPAGTILIWDNKQEKRYQIKIEQEKKEYASCHHFQEEFPQLMDTVVKDHMISDKPIGIFLSGGMDSSILLHHMRNHQKEDLHTFTVRFEATEQEGGRQRNIDADLAQETAKIYGTIHTEITLTAKDFYEHYAETARSLDQPNADHVSVAQYVLSKKAKEYVDVILCGAGGDELFGGYPRYQIAYILQKYRWIPSWMRQCGARLLHYPIDVAGMQVDAMLAERLLARKKEEWMPLINGNWFQGEKATKWFQNVWSQQDNADSVRQFFEMDRATWLIDESLKLVDGTTMANGIEGRVPFLDQRIIAASKGTKTKWHLSSYQTKKLLKDTYRSILPDHLFTLKKASFYPPLAKWLRRECEPLISQALSHPWIQEMFNVRELKNRAEEHKNRTGYHLHVLHAIIQLQQWYDEVYSLEEKRVY